MPKKIKLDKEEKGIIDALTKGQLKSVADKQSEIKKHVLYSSQANKKTQRLNIRISEQDLDALKIRAHEEGLPYQTYVSSILHKFVTGKIFKKAA